MSYVTAIASEDSLWRALESFLLLRDYNTRVVVLGAVLLGAAAGLIGTFMLLRKRALIGDALSHATLPGIVAVFMFATISGMDAKSLPLLLVGAAGSGLLGILMVLILRNSTRIKEDSAMGIVLSVFFGGGIALLGIAQRMEQGHSAGLESFIYGKTASMVASDAMLIGLVALCAAGLSMSFYKEFRLICFDESYARSQGWPVLLLDVVLMAMVTLVTVIGLQAVGLVLVIALLVIPAAAARFWTNRLWKMLVIAATAGALSCYVGTLASAMLPDLPSGAMIVLATSLVFALSMFLGPAGGLVHRYRTYRKLQRKIARQNVLRAIFELVEHGIEDTGVPQHIPAVSFEAILTKRSWNRRHLARELRRCQSGGMVVHMGDHHWRLTTEGLAEARRIARQHRLWEIYLISHADIAPSHVDRSADMIEHVLGEGLVAELEAMLDAGKKATPPASPHSIGGKESGDVAHA